MQRLAIDAAREILERVAHEQRRYAAGVFDVFDSAINAATRFRQRLAMLARNALADAIEIFFDQLPVTEKQARAFHRRRVAPRGKRRRRRIPPPRSRHAVRRTRNLRDHFTARRIEDRRRSRRRFLCHSPPMKPDTETVTVRCMLRCLTIASPRERVRLFHEIVAAPFAVGVRPFSSRRLRQRRLSASALRSLLHAHELGVRGEIIEALAFEIGQRFELVLLHEREQLVAHRLHAFVAELHHAGADLHGVAAEQDELRRVVAGFDAADGRERSAREIRCRSWSRSPCTMRSAIGRTALHE